MRDYYLSVIDGSRQGLVAMCVRAVLGVLSWGYCLVVVSLRYAHQRGVLRSADLGYPVISVGNLTWGGTGKTPLVGLIVQELMASGKKPAILIRGYMSHRNSGRDAGVQSDEARLLSDMFAGRVPVIACRDRVKGAAMIPLDYGCDVIVLDDGFQHWRVKRDVDIAVINAMDPFGNGSVIPRGSLREPLSALKNANLCVISKVNLAPGSVEGIRQQIQERAPAMLFAEAAYQPVTAKDLRTEARYGLDRLKGQPVVLLSGIGSPRGFERAIEGIGADIRQHLIYPDHFVYQPADGDRALACLDSAGARVLVTTEKDSMKFVRLIPAFPEDVQIFSLVMEMRIINGKEVLLDALGSVFSS